MKQPDKLYLKDCIPDFFAPNAADPESPLTACRRRPARVDFIHAPFFRWQSAVSLADGALPLLLPAPWTTCLLQPSSCSSACSALVDCSLSNSAPEGVPATRCCHNGLQETRW